MTRKFVLKFWPLFFVLLYLVSATAIAQDKVIRISERFIKERLDRYSLLDRSRILQGLAYAAELSQVPEPKRGAWADFIKANLPALIRDLSPSKDEDTLEAAAKPL